MRELIEELKEEKNNLINTSPLHSSDPLSPVSLQAKINTLKNELQVLEKNSEDHMKVSIYNYKQHHVLLTRVASAFIIGGLVFLIIQWLFLRPSTTMRSNYGKIVTDKRNVTHPVGGHSSPSNKNISQVNRNEKTAQKNHHVFASLLIATLTSIVVFLYQTKDLRRQHQGNFKGAIIKLACWYKGELSLDMAVGTWKKTQGTTKDGLSHVIFTPAHNSPSVQGPFPFSYKPSIFENNPYLKIRGIQRKKDNKVYLEKINLKKEELKESVDLLKKINEWKNRTVLKRTAIDHFHTTFSKWDTEDTTFYTACKSIAEM